MFETGWPPRTDSALTLVAGGSAATVAAAFLLRSIKRSFSPKIKCTLRCKCGQIEGTICAKHEDSMQASCFCGDCRKYAQFVADQGNHPEGTGVVGPCGEVRLVQVCKSDLEIHKGKELLQLCRKDAPKPGEEGSLFRYYSKCCHVPLLNTVDFLGICGVFAEFLDENQTKFDGPVALFPESALKEPTESLGKFVLPGFLWKLLRYQTARRKGPFEYDQEPVYWGPAFAEKKES